MGKFLKFAIGVAVLGFVGLICLGVMSMIAARVFAHREAPGDALQQSVYKTFNSAPAVIPPPPPVDPSWERSVQVQVNSHSPIVDLVGLLGSFALLVAILGAVAIVMRYRRRGAVALPPDDTALVYELARRAQDLAQRMEALETILLDRTRAAR